MQYSLIFKLESGGDHKVSAAFGENILSAAIRAGVRKINYFTYMDKAGGQAAESYLQGLEPHAPRFFSSVLAAAQQAMQENLISAMKTFALMEDK